MEQRNDTGERRREDDIFKKEMRDFMSASTTYRAKDEVTQKYQVDKIVDLDNKVGIQNGRIVKLEKRQEEMDSKIKQRKDNYTTVMAWITIIATVIMAVSSFAIYFKK